MRPERLKTRIFLDGGNPGETGDATRILGFLDGQTTNPTLISKNPGIRERVQRGEKFSADALLDFYRDVVKKVSAMVQRGSVSIEVFSDKHTKAEAMLEQGRKMFAWIPNAHIKFPTSAEGLKAASTAVSEGLRVNMTLCFAQSQAAAVYAATRAHAGAMSSSRPSSGGSTTGARTAWTSSRTSSGCTAMATATWRCSLRA